MTRLKFERYKGLLAEKAVSQQDYDDREAALKQAEADIEYCKAAVETGRINLDYTRVTAPISGRIGKSNVTDGALVTAYQPLPLATIQQLDPIYVDVPQSTSELLRLRRRLEDKHLHQNGTNQKTIRAHPGRRHKISIGRGASVSRHHGGSVDGFRCPAGCLSKSGRGPPAGNVRPGGGEGGHKCASHPHSSAGSVTRSKGNPITLIVDDEGKIQQRRLILDRAIGDKWLVSSGLEPGDRVVVEGMQRVRPGTSVKVAPFDAARKAEAEPGEIRQPGKAN